MRHGANRHRVQVASLDGEQQGHLRSCGGGSEGVTQCCWRAGEGHRLEMKPRGRTSLAWQDIPPGTAETGMCKPPVWWGGKVGDKPPRAAKLGGVPLSAVPGSRLTPLTGWTQATGQHGTGCALGVRAAWRSQCVQPREGPRSSMIGRAASRVREPRGCACVCVPGAVMCQTKAPPPTWDHGQITHRCLSDTGPVAPNGGPLHALAPHTWTCPLGRILFHGCLLTQTLVSTATV